MTDTTNDRRRGPRNMSQAHKDALEQGRQEGRAIRGYLDALRAHKPKRGRKRTRESVENRLAVVEAELPDAESLDAVRLIQERMNLTAELETIDEAFDIADLEKGFIEMVGSYSARQGISYAAWREVGVPAAVLKAAGIARTREQ